MKFLLAFDKFKGTLTAAEAAGIVRSALAERFPQAGIVTVPVSDGGGGMTELLVSSLGAARRTARVIGPEGIPVCAEYALLPDGAAAFEMCSCAGLTLMKAPAPLSATTAGVGELIRLTGAERILLGLGGSATCDCGIGMAAALGWRFIDGAGAELPPFAASLGRVRRILPPACEPRVSVVAACDVDSPLTGPRGAVRVFGPQKGVTPELMPAFERGFENMAAVLGDHAGFDVAGLPGAGAAGGLGAAIAALLGGELKPGAELLLDAAAFDRLLDGVDYVFTGEGRLDAQTDMGKAVSAVARRARIRGVPCIAVCGATAPGAGRELAAVFAASDSPRPIEELRLTCRAELAAAAGEAAAYVERTVAHA